MAKDLPVSVMNVLKFLNFVSKAYGDKVRCIVRSQIPEEIEDVDIEQLDKALLQALQKVRQEDDELLALPEICFTSHPE